MEADRKKAWWYFWKPFLHFIGGAGAFIAIVYLVGALIANIIWLFQLWMETEAQVWPWLAYSGFVSWVVLFFIIGAIIYDEMRVHYKNCQDRVYRENHKVPKYCKNPYDHRLNHTIGEACPCKK